MKHVKFQIIGLAKLTEDEWEPLMKALDRRLPGCNPGTVDETHWPSEADYPVEAIGKIDLNTPVYAKFVRMQVSDKMRLTVALQVVNDALREIGRDDLRAELREM